MDSLTSAELARRKSAIPALLSTAAKAINNREGTIAGLALRLALLLFID
jgi:hypothetical protein